MCLGVLSFRRAKPKPAYQSVHARVPESVVFDFVKSPVMPTLDIKARPKAPENSGLAQLEKKLKVPWRRAQTCTICSAVVCYEQ